METIQLLLLIFVCVVIAFVLIKSRRGIDTTITDDFVLKTSSDTIDRRERKRMSDELKTILEQKPGKLYEMQLQRERFSR